MKYTIHQDGSFDISTPAGILRNCWPGIDLKAVRCSRVDTNDSSITYHTRNGQIQLSFGEDTLDSKLIGFTTAPHWFQVIHNAEPTGLSSFFRQGIGFSGPSGRLNLNDLGNEAWSYESYLHHVWCNNGDQTLSIYPTEHKNFLFRSNIEQQCFHHNFRNREIGESQVLFSCGFRTEQIPVTDKITLPTLHIREGNGLYQSLCDNADHLGQANNARAPSAPRYHYCSWYHHTDRLSEDVYFDIIDGMKRVDPNNYIQAAQIDDGYCTSRGDWLTFKDSLWPNGMKPVFEKTAEAGYDPGIWVAPFMVGCSSSIATEHPDWLLHDLEGNRLTEWKRYHHGSPDFEHYILDTSHPDALAWIKTVFETFYEWGVRVYKTDFLEWGYKDSTKVKRYTPGKTGAQYFDDVMSCIRTAIKDSYWLGCITYFAPSIGYMDGMRMTSDVGVQWNSTGGTGNDGCGGGTENMVEESFATLYMNNRLWQNDPDVTFFRDYHNHLSETEVKSLAYYNGLMGHSVNTSCELGEVHPDRLKLWQWLRPQAEPFTATLPYFGKKHPFRVVLRDYPQANGWALLIMNEFKKDQCGVVNMFDLIGQPEAVAFRWDQNQAEAIGIHSQFAEQLEGHGHALYFISRDGKAPPSNLNLGGSFEE